MPGAVLTSLLQHSVSFFVVVALNFKNYKFSSSTVLTEVNFFYICCVFFFSQVGVRTRVVLCSPVECAEDVCVVLASRMCR